MNLIFVVNARFSQTSNGNIYGYHTAVNYKTFEHYLKVFDKVKVIARVEQAGDQKFDESIRVNLANVEVIAVPYFLGPLQYIKKSRHIKNTIRKLIDNNDALICRIPGTLGRLAANEAVKRGRPYAVEVAADPYDVFAPGSFNHPLRNFFRYFGTEQLRNNVKGSSAAIYVTATQLQKRYPVKNGVFNTYASNVILPEAAFANSPKVLQAKQIYTLISIGTLDQMYKAPDVLIKAVQYINSQQPYKVKLVWLGNGKYKAEMEELAKALNVSDYIEFAGVVRPAEKVREHIDEADIFVLASRTEGLPRAMVEAMARGLPCIGTKIGGIPELLNDDMLVPINDHIALAKSVIETISDKEKANKEAAGNLTLAKDYAYDVLNERRMNFYKKIVEITADYKR